MAFVSQSALDRVDLRAALREGLLAAVVMFGLAVVIIGLRTVDQRGGLGLEPRLDWVLLAVAVVFAGRVLLAVRRQLRRQATRVGADFGDRLATRVAKAAIYLGPILIFVAVVLPFLPGINRYHMDVATLVLTYVMLGWGLNIVVGLAGLLDLGYVAFYAVGAYTYALLGLYFDWSFWLALPVAGFVAAMFGVLLGFPVLRLRGDYLAIVTLGFGEIIRIILINWWSFTNGPDGISGIPRPSFFGFAEFKRSATDGGVTFAEMFGLDYAGIHRVIFLYYLVLILALVVNVFTMRVRKLPVGRAWEALREDEIACRSLGINPTNTKLTAFAIGAMFAGFAGSFFATRNGFVSPESFTFIESALILAIVVLGGGGSQIGVVIAATLLIGGTEFFRGLEEFRMLVFGAAMVGIMVWRPRGLLAHREPTLRLTEARAGAPPPPTATAPVAEKAPS